MSEPTTKRRQGFSCITAQRRSEIARMGGFARAAKHPGLTGFALMDPQRLKQISSASGSKAAKNKTMAQRRVMGKRGGAALVRSRGREWMAAIGRRSWINRHCSAKPASHAIEPPQKQATTKSTPMPRAVPTPKIDHRLRPVLCVEHQQRFVNCFEAADYCGLSGAKAAARIANAAQSDEEIEELHFRFADERTTP